MPIYEYFCPRCRAAFEKLRPMASSDAAVLCPKCGSQVRRMFSVVAAVSRNTEAGQSYSGSGGCGCGGNCACGRHN